MTNQTAVVTCGATTTKGKPCKNQATHNGFCNVHKAKELIEKKKVKRSGAARKNATKKPLPGANDELANLINVMDKPEVADGTTKPAFVGGQWVEVPVDVAADVVQISEDIAAEEELERPVADAIAEFIRQGIIKSDIGYSVFEALEIIKQYKALLKYVDTDSVKDKVALAEVLVDVVKMSSEEVLKESLATTALINKFSLQVKYMREDAKAEYGVDIPADITEQIEELDTIIFKLKCGKGILMAALEIHEQTPEEDEPKKDKPSLFARFTGWVNKNWKSAATACVILAGIVMVLVATMNANDVQPPVKHSAPPVVAEKPVGEHVPANFADVGNAKPVDVGEHVPANLADFGNAKTVVVADEVDGIYTVQDDDTLWDIAENLYGDGSKWTKLYDANSDTLVHDDARNLDDAGHWIHAGQSLKVFFDDDVTHDALNDH